MNKSEWVYDVCGGGDYIDAAISSLGISDEQLMQNVAQRVPKRVKSTPAVPIILKKAKRYASCWCNLSQTAQE